MPEAQSLSVDESPLEEDRVFEAAPRFPKTEVFRFLGGGNGRIGSRQTVKRVHNWTARLGSLVKPRIVYSMEPVVLVTKSSIQFENGISFKSVKMAKALQGCRHAVCFVATLGTAVEKEIQKLTGDNHISEAFIVDAIGSVGTEQMVEQFHQQMGALFRRRGKGVTLRFSPGYCDWALGDQRKLFRMVRSHPNRRSSYPILTYDSLEIRIGHLRCKRESIFRAETLQPLYQLRQSRLHCPATFLSLFGAEQERAELLLGGYYLCIPGRDFLAVNTDL